MDKDIDKRDNLALVLIYVVLGLLIVGVMALGMFAAKANAETCFNGSECLNLYKTYPFGSSSNFSVSSTASRIYTFTASSTGVLTTGEFGVAAGSSNLYFQIRSSGLVLDTSAPIAALTVNSNATTTFNAGLQISQGGVYELWTYTDGANRNILYNPSAATSSPNIITPYFRLDSSLTSSAYINFTQPNPVNATTTDFASWEFNYSNPYGGTGHTTQITVSYSNGSSTWIDQEFNLPTGQQNLVSFEKTQPLPVGSYTAVAGLFDSYKTSSSQTNTLIASSTIINFDVVSGWAGTTGGHLIETANCPADSDWWCPFIQFLIVPHRPITDFVDQTNETFKNTFPFNIFFDFNSILQSEASSTITGKDLVMTINTGGYNISIPIITSSSLEQTIGVDNKNRLFEFETALIWVVLGIVLYNRIKV